jgi:hypothetical protein
VDQRIGFNTYAERGNADVRKDAVKTLFDQKDDEDDIAEPRMTERALPGIGRR